MKLLLSAFSFLLLLAASGCATRPCLFSPLLDVQNRSTPNRAQAAIGAPDAQRGVLTPLEAPRGYQRAAKSLQGYAGFSDPAPVKPFWRVAGFEGRMARGKAA